MEDDFFELLEDTEEAERRANERGGCAHPFLFVFALIIFAIAVFAVTR